MPQYMLTGRWQVRAARLDEPSEDLQIVGVLRGDERAQLVADERRQQERPELMVDAAEPPSIGLTSDDDEPPRGLAHARDLRADS